MQEQDPQNDSEIRDISDTINKIIELLLPLYETKSEESPEAMLDFVVALYGSSAKLCGELNMEQQEALLIFNHTWEMMEEAKKKELN
jgi:hypothetical protein